MICIDQYKKLINKKFNVVRYVYSRLTNTVLNMHITLFRMLKTKNKLRKIILKNKLERKYNCIFALNCKIDDTVTFPHPLGIVVGNKVEIKPNCKIYQNVTLGVKNECYPIIESGVTIYANAVVLGNVTIGENSIVGAGAVVLKSCGSSSVLVGVPAKNIKSN